MEYVNGSLDTYWANRCRESVPLGTGLRRCFLQMAVISPCNMWNLQILNLKWYKS